MPFTNWIKKLDRYAQEELREDILPLLSDKELLEYFDDLIDEIHNRGIDLEAEYKAGNHGQHC
jgi:hypothetical protein